MRANLAHMTPTEIYAAHVPRYTSYPTAPHFHTGVHAGTYEGWLAGLPEGIPLSLYLHVPFCDTLCWFCACHTKIVNHYGPVKDYVGWLLREIALVAKTLGDRRSVSHIHFGGGSPTMLSGEDMRRLRHALDTAFEIGSGAEIAIEIDPRGFGIEQADMLAELGVTRASIGLQDCHPRVQRAINRLQSTDELRNTIDLLRERNIDRINLDLVYGLPYQTLAGLEKNLEVADALKPSRLALFGYAHVPFFKKHQALIPQEALPDVTTRLQMAAFAEDWLMAHGYQAIGLDHFARPDDELAAAARLGVLHRNFQGYTVDAAPALLGLGASAIGALPQGYVQNQASVSDYRSDLAKDKLPIAKGIALSPEDRLRRDAIEQVMCYLTVDLGATALDHGRAEDELDWVLPLLRPLTDCGAVTVKDRIVTVSRSQRAAARILASLFDGYLGAGAARHSVSA